MNTNFFDTVFWQNFVSDSAATLSGVVFGIPAALWIERLRQRTADAQAKAALRQAENVHKAKILALVKTELEFNYAHLSARQPALVGRTQELYLAEILKDEFWQAISDSDELRWIRDLHLIDVISTAYYLIRTVKFLEEIYARETLFDDPIAMWPHLKARLELDQSRALKAVNFALDEIGKGLSELPSK